MVRGKSMSENTIAEKPQKKHRTFYMSLRVRLLVIFTLLFSLIFGAAYYWFFTFSTRTAQQRIQEDLLDTLKGGVKGIDGDELVALSKEGKANADGLTSDDPRYQKMIAWLDLVHSVEPR